MTQGIERWKVTATTPAYIQEQPTKNCNLKYKISDHIPIVFHNLSGYDYHLFIKELGRRFNKNDIAESKEKYISLNVKINVYGIKFR